MRIDIPKGQKVRIRRYKPGAENQRGRRNIAFQDKLDGINDTSFILMEPVTFNVNSSYTSLLGNEAVSTSLPQYLAGELAKAFGGNTIAGVLTGITEYSGFQRWSGTDLLSTELSVGLIAQEDAYKEVVLPMLNLIKLTIPTVNHSTSKIIDKARTLRLPGPSLIKTIQQAFGKDVSGGEYTESDTELTICVGNLVFDHVIITGVTPTIMPDTDTNGYPLSVFLKIVFKGTRIPNDETIGDIFSGWTE